MTAPSFGRQLPAAAMLLVLIGLAPATGCSANRPLNPSFALGADQARLAISEMAADPQPLQRPVVVVGGIFDMGPFAAAMARRLRKLTSDDDQIIAVTFFGLNSFDRCHKKLVEAIDERFPTDDPNGTREVDVVGVSMGGLVARYAAAPAEPGARPVRIRRLFTIATPHQGAKLAWVPTFDDRIIDMRHGSAFLTRLNEHLDDVGYDLYAYARLGDQIVGEDNCAPPGTAAWWVANMPFSGAHIGADADPRILADIARRLRGEPAFTTSPPAPLPDLAGDPEAASAPSG